MMLAEKADWLMDGTHLGFLSIGFERAVDY